MIDYVISKLYGQIHNLQISAVISIFLDELLKDLLSGKKIKFHNLGDLYFKINQPRKHFNVWTQKVELSDKNRILIFDIAFKLKKNMAKFLDIDKTFGKP